MTGGDLVIYCFLTSYLQTNDLKQYLLSLFPWVRNSGTTSLDASSSESLTGYIKCSLGLPSIPDLTWGGSDSEITHIAVGRQEVLAGCCWSNLIDTLASP